MIETHIREYQRSSWRSVREAAEDAFAMRQTYTIATGGKVHQVATVAELAAVTRQERMLWGVEWREDAKVV